MIRTLQVEKLDLLADMMSSDSSDDSEDEESSEEKEPEIKQVTQIQVQTTVSYYLLTLF